MLCIVCGHYHGEVDRCVLCVDTIMGKQTGVVYYVWTLSWGSRQVLCIICGLCCWGGGGGEGSGGGT